MSFRGRPSWCNRYSLVSEKGVIDHNIRTLVTPASLNDVGSGHADGEKNATQLNHHCCLRNMVWVVCVGEHEETPLPTRWYPRPLARIAYQGSFTTPAHRQGQQRRSPKDVEVPRSASNRTVVWRGHCASARNACSVSLAHTTALLS
jgi:hypothetical protein